jgi:hypothetical protein
MNVIIQFNNQPITNGLISYSLIVSQIYDIGPINLQLDSNYILKSNIVS